MLTDLMDEADLCAVMACDGQWQQVAPQGQRLLATSSFAYTMFSFIDEMLSSNSYATDIESLLDELFESQVTEDTAAKFRSQAADPASRYKEDFMPTKREIEIKIMGFKLTDVVHDVNAEWEVRFLCRLFDNGAESERHVGTTPFRGMDLPCSDSRCLERRQQFVEGDDHRTQSHG